MTAPGLGALTKDDLKSISTPLDRCVCVYVGRIDSDIVQKLEELGYDAAPVLDGESQRVCGLITTEHVRSLVNQGKPLSSDDPAIRRDQVWFRVESVVELSCFLGAMGEQRSLLLTFDCDGAEDSHDRSQLGLVTISDLNRHPLRAALYSLLAHVEAQLARLVESTFTDPWSWVSFLDEHQQATVLGYWELSKRKGIDVGPVAATTLSQLVRIVGKSEQLLRDLGFDSHRQYKKATGKLTDIRNRVMHPVRPLVLDHSDVATVLTAVRMLSSLADRMSAASGAHSS